MNSPLTHFDAQGQAHMVDVGAKDETHRVARAAGRIRMQPRDAGAHCRRARRKGRRDRHRAHRGDPWPPSARLGTDPAVPPSCPSRAWRWISKWTPALSEVRCTAQVETRGRTGVEMEALTAVQVGLLTIYDMCKAGRPRHGDDGHPRCWPRAAARAGTGPRPKAYGLTNSRQSGRRSDGWHWNGALARCGGLQAAKNSCAPGLRNSRSRSAMKRASLRSPWASSARAQAIIKRVSSRKWVALSNGVIGARRRLDGGRIKRLSLSSASTRWGSASADGAIRLNWRLIHFGLPVIDYVVTHELAHLREMNHSPAFWDVVRSVLPNFEQARVHLRDEVLPVLE